MIKALDEWTVNNSSSLSKGNFLQIAEIRRLIVRLNSSFKDLIVINEKLIMANPFRINTEFDAETDMYTVKVGEQSLSTKLRRANPKTPISFQKLDSGIGYLSGADSSETKDERELRLEMETRLEHYYNAAHRVQKLIQKLPGGRGFECRPVTIARNQLMEHLENNHERYSFGYGLSGPRLRPAHTGLVKWNDNGLIPNTKEFIEALLKQFAPEQ